MSTQPRRGARRGGIAALAAVLLGAACAPPDAGPAPEKPAAPREKPRRQLVVLFSIDTLRADHLGAYGYERPTSPAIDAFARDAVLFERAIAAAPSTAPTHMSLLTGLEPPVHGVFNPQPDRKIAPAPLDPAIRTFPQMLKARGWLTAGLHGGGALDAAFGFARGFDVYSSDLVSRRWFLAHESRADLAAVPKLLELAEERGRPLFLFLHHYVCHGPYLTAPESTRDRFLAGRRVPGLSIGVADDVKRRFLADWDRAGGAPIKAGLERAGEGRLRDFWDGVDLARADHRAHVVAMYDAGVAFADFLFGEIVAILKEAGAYDDALVVLLSDHGEEFYEHEGREHGRLYTEHLHVPLVVKLPAASGVRPARVAAPVGTIDVMPTVLDFLGEPIQTPIQGRSFLALVKGGGGPFRDRVTSYNNHGAAFTGVRVETDGAAYALLNPELGTERLFDLGSDAAEQRDLAASDPARLEALRALARHDLAEANGFLEKIRAAGGPTPTVDPALLRQLKELGYIK